jgi:hypothetical protein
MLYAAQSTKPRFQDAVVVLGLGGRFVDLLAVHKVRVVLG